MPLYMVEFAYTPDAWATLAKNPEDRAHAFGDLVRRAGGSLESFYYSFGDFDGVAIIDMPDENGAYGVTVAANTPGHLRAIRTSRLLTTDEALAVMRTAGALPHRAPSPKVPFRGIAPG
ncbi:MAG: GYD domain-containing protein [Actinomycetes bacterium]